MIINEVDEFDVWSKKFHIDKQILKKSASAVRDLYNRGDITATEFWAEVERRTGITIQEDHRALFVEGIQSAQPFPGIFEFVKSLQDQGYFCGIISDVFEPDKNYIQKQGRYDLFDDLILSCDIHDSKRHNALSQTHNIFDYALNKHGIVGTNAIFIDDSQINLNVASKAGMNVILAGDSMEMREKLLEQIEHY